MIVHPNLIQQSKEWFQARAGRPSASRFKDIFTAKTCALSASRFAYIHELIGQRFAPTFVYFGGNSNTDRGNDTEPEARQAFVDTTGIQVEEVGFCTQDNGVIGCSPDGLIRGPDGEYCEGLEIKCPSPKVHIGYVIDGVLPDDYKQQVHGSMAVTGLNRWHFWSYYPGLKPLHLIVERDDYTKKLSAALVQFLSEYGAACDDLIPKLQLKNQSNALPQ